MQKTETKSDFTLITPDAPISVHEHGWKTKCLQRLVRLGLPVPKAVAIPTETVSDIATGRMIDAAGIMREFGDDPLVSVRASPVESHWGGPAPILNVGLNSRRHSHLVESHGREAADQLFIRFIRQYAIHVAHLDPDLFEEMPEMANPVPTILDLFAQEADEPFPEDPAHQLSAVLASMAHAWNGVSARLLRKAKGAPEEAPLGFVVQQMIQGYGQGFFGSGVIQFIDSATGERRVSGRYLGQSQGRDALKARDSLFLTRGARGPSLEETAPDIVDDLKRCGAICRSNLHEELQIEFTIEEGRLAILDASRTQRSARAALNVAVTLADDGIIDRQEAVLRVDPETLTELLHYQVDPDEKPDILVTGLPASPGAASGMLAFSLEAAETYAARGEPFILVRRETGPEDVHGMHAAAGVLTERGGMSSHAAVIARGLGIPCVVAASRLELDLDEGKVSVPDGRVFAEGDLVTLDGTHGRVLAGSAAMLPPALDGDFQKLLSWADEFREMGVRANADTPEDARAARRFEAEGIGLCRTEHMFFEGDRLLAMQQMIFADSAEERATSLEILQPMQRADFVQLFEIMDGRPVCMRLFDLPLHEFLPRTQAGLRELARALDLSFSDVLRRAEYLRDVNPMLGLRGVRLGIIMPEIYAMQARAIFEATLETSRPDRPVVPDIMIPLVSTPSEVEIVHDRIAAIAAQVRAEQGDFSYRLGVMVETPRAALSAGAIAEHAAFLSFGTNDLTQMTYGLSRDDAGRFMGDYLAGGVFAEDPFRELDLEAVGELLEIGATRGRAARPDLTLSLCGEHGGNPETIAFCHRAGFDYVSCSPYRVPKARLAAAHLALTQPRGDKRMS